MSKFYPNNSLSLVRAVISIRNYPELVVIADWRHRLECDIDNSDIFKGNSLSVFSAFRDSAKILQESICIDLYLHITIKIRDKTRLINHIILALIIHIKSEFRMKISDLLRNILRGSYVNL